MANVDPKILTAFGLMIGGVDDVVRKGVGVPYVALRGNMYAMVSRQNAIGIMIDDEDWKSFEMAGGTTFDAVPGIPLKGFGAIPETMYKDRLQLQSWFRRAYAAAEKLPAKIIEFPKRPGEATKPVEPAKPVEVAKPVEPLKPVELRLVVNETPAEPVAPAEPPEPLAG